MWKYNSTGIYRICQSIFLFLSVVVLSACKCEDACDRGNTIGTPASSSGSSSSSGSGGNGAAPSLTYLDCSNLDPKRVYLLGTLSPGNAIFALVDVDDPTTFCVGFVGHEGADGLSMSEQGHLIGQYTNNEGRHVSKLNQEALLVETTDDSWNWEYPEDSSSNDDSLFVPADVTYHFYLKYDESIGSDVYYYQRYETGPVYLNTAGSEVYYDNPDNLSMISVLSDGTLLMDKDTDLFVIDPELNKIQLTLPDAEEHFYERTSRSYLDSATGNEHIWIIVQDAEFMNDRRWSINTETWEVLDDGLFAALPEMVDPAQYINPNTSKPLRGKYKKIDGNGNLIQVSDYLSPPPNAVGDINSPSYSSVLLRRPIASSGEEATILHSDAEYPGDFQWKTEPLPFVHIFSGVLVTGK